MAKATRKKKETTKNTKPKRTEAQNLALSMRLLSKMLLQAAKEQQEPLPEPEPFALIIDSIRHLKLSTFIKCYTGDKNELILAGEPTERQLAEAWEVLKNQYFDASGNQAAKEANGRHMNKMGFASHLNRVRIIIDAINKVMGIQELEFIDKFERLPPLFDELRLDGYDYLFTAESYIADLQMVSNELIGWELKIEEIEAEEQAEIEKSGSKPVEINEEYFLEQLAELRKFEHYPLPPTQLAEKMTVWDYCSSLKRYNEHVTRIKLQQEHGNG